MTTMTSERSTSPPDAIAGVITSEDCLAGRVTMMEHGKQFNNGGSNKDNNSVENSRSDESLQKILLNTPEIWTYEVSQHKHLIKPMIKNYEKFNSNTGW